MRSARKTEAHAGLDYRDCPRQRRNGGHVAQTECEEGRATHVEVGEEAGPAFGGKQARAKRPMQCGEPNNEIECPDAEKHQQGEGAVVAQETLAPVAAMDALRQSRPGCPGHAVENPANADAGPRPAGQDNRLEAVPQDDEDQEQAADSGKHSHPSRPLPA